MRGIAWLSDMVGNEWVGGIIILSECAGVGGWHGVRNGAQVWAVRRGVRDGVRAGVARQSVRDGARVMTRSYISISDREKSVIPIRHRFLCAR